MSAEGAGGGGDGEYGYKLLWNGAAGVPASLESTLQSRRSRNVVGTLRAAVGVWQGVIPLGGRTDSGFANAA